MHDPQHMLYALSAQHWLHTKRGTTSPAGYNYTTFHGTHASVTTSTFLLSTRLLKQYGMMSCNMSPICNTLWIWIWCRPQEANTMLHYGTTEHRHIWE